jgi:hypothetical protein
LKEGGDVSTKDELIATLRDVDQRLVGLTPRILANLDRPLLSGTWTVHDCLCHIAADSNAVYAWRYRLENGRRVQGDMSTDDFNQQEIDKRKGLPAEEVVREIRDNFSGDMAAIRELDEELLRREMPYRGGMAPAAESLRFYLGPHNTSHLDDIEKALDA